MFFQFPTIVLQTFSLLLSFANDFPKTTAKLPFSHWSPVLEPTDLHLRHCRRSKPSALDLHCFKLRVARTVASCLVGGFLDENFLHKTHAFVNPATEIRPKKYHPVVNCWFCFGFVCAATVISPRSFQNPCEFDYTDWLIGILMMVY